MAVIFRVLGPFEAYVDGTRVDLGGPRPRLLLARLIVARGATVSVDALLDDLHDGEPPPRALGTLHSYISNLRRTLEPGRAPRTPSAVLVSRPSGYALGPHEVDAGEFSLLAREGAYGEALRLWRGTPYEEFSDVGWLRPEIERLNEAHLVTREKHLARLLDDGDPGVAGELEPLVRAHPLREGLWELLARALYRLGRQADALEALRSARTYLAEELGLDPGPGLQRLEAAILTQDPALDAPAPAPAGSPPPAVRSEPVPAGPAHQVGSATDSPHRPVTDLVAGPPVVGRDPQLERLAELAQDAARGRPRIAVISGEPGIGKTWLAEAFAGMRGAEGWLVAWGRCHETSGAPALWPWQQVLRELSAEVPPESGHAAALSVLLSDDVEEARPAEAGEARFRLHRATSSYLTLVAASRPLLVVVDDLQWADSASLGLLADLATLLRGRIMIMITVRSGEGSADVYDALGMLGRHDALRLALAGLDTAAVAELAGLGDEATAGALTERTRGNPLFIRETLRLAEEVGMGRALTAVPEGLADVLRQRLLRLPRAHRAVIDAAAVLGGGTDTSVLSEVTGERVEEALDAAADLKLLTGDLRFTHDLVRETVYADLPSSRRAALHLAALNALERRPGPDRAALARHALAAGPAAAAKAVRWTSATAEQASGRHAYEDAAQWWRRAAETHRNLPDTDPAEHVELLLNLIRAQLDAGDAVGARQTRTEAVLAAEGSDDPELTARALTSLDAPALWKFFTYAEIELQTVQRIEDTLAALPDEDSVLRCKLLGCLGMERYDGSADPRCDTATAEALAMARRLVTRGEAGPQLLAITLNARYLGIHLPERVPEVEVIARELTGLGLPGFELLGHLILERSRLEFFDVAGADRAAERTRVLIERLNLPWPRFQHLLWTGARRLIEGDFTGADSAYASAAEAGERLNNWHTWTALASGMVARHLMSGEIGGVLDEPEELLDRFSPIPAHRRVVGALAAHARGEPEPLLAVSGEGWPTMPRDFTELSSLCIMALAQITAGDRESCARSYERLLPYGDRLAIGAGTFPSGPVAYFLGRLAADPAVAGAHLDAAEESCARAGLHWWAARVAAERDALGRL
ncbi:BTAD domain-containing putative transcriptional regulator [Streptosporangium sp. NPDC051023]|uniref:BTAD domain-containing putative transcriptional regulator n=1 Tax=Streptosporangium sp. NPDC051023 TaxID=3155410 RepID=UPI00344DDCF9